MSLKEVIAADIEDVFLNEDDFAVSIRYQSNPTRFPNDNWKETTEPFSAIVSSSLFEIAEGIGATQLETRDYSFAPSKILLRGYVRLPEKGDLIIEGNRKYAAVEPGGQRCYSLDEDRLLITVHTVLVKSDQ